MKSEEQIKQEVLKQTLEVIIYIILISAIIVISDFISKLR